MSTVLVALIVAAAAMAGPLLLASQNARRADAKEKRDNDRMDEVAAQAAEAARLLLIENKRVADAALTTNNKLDVIHTLVNSNMTAAMQAEADATVRELAMMREVISLNEAAGRKPSIEALAAVDATEAKIAELTAALEDRLKAAVVVEQQQQQQQQQQGGA